MAVTREQILQWTGGSTKGADILAASQRYGFTPADVDAAFGLASGTSATKAAQLTAPAAVNPVPSVPTYGLSNEQQRFLQQQQVTPGLQVPPTLMNQPGQVSNAPATPGLTAPKTYTNDEINAAISAIRNKYATTGPGAADRALNEMVDLMIAKGVSPQQVAAATGKPVTGIQSAVDRYSPMNIPPEYGLRGAENSLREGIKAALERLDSTMGRVADTYQTGIQGLQPYMQTGGRANDVQAALSGALGPEAQAKAMQEYQSSPFMEQARKNAERAILQNASATGSLGSGNTLDQLYQNAAGLFLGDFNDNFMRLGDVANRGLGSASNAAGMYSSLGGIQAGLGQYGASIPYNAGSETASYRYSAGRDIADSLSGASSSLAALQDRMGVGVTELIGNQTNSVKNLFDQAFEGDALAKEQLATILADLGISASSIYSGLQNVPGLRTDWLGTLGKVSSGISGMMDGWNAVTG